MAAAADLYILPFRLDPVIDEATKTTYHQLAFFIEDDDKSTCSLLFTFESLREQMIEKAMRLGFNHPEVIRLSQKVDQIHNQLLCIS